MQRTGILFVIVCSIVGTGIILSYYGSQIIYDELIKGEGQVKIGENLIISDEFDSKKTQIGNYAIQIIDFKEGVTAKILDPFDKEIEFQSINKEVFQGRFNITMSGIYKLVIENTDEKEIKIFGVIGPEPDAGKKSLWFISFWIIIIGLIGVVGVAIYAIKNRTKSFS